ncbi:MAG: TonB-dependent receptor [Acidobacteriota bacterium]|nr:TonB-dependent receptor [Acidobacteriota bacterium]
MHSLRRLLVLSIALAALASTARAQTPGTRLVGTVTDAQGGALPGVTVTATSPALIGSQVAVSEGNGTYQFPALPAGTYTLTFVLDGFQTVTRERIALAVGQTLTVDAQLPLASLKESVTVTAGSPVVDTQTTAIGNTLNEAKLTGVPTSTDLWGALARTPGLRMQGFDVGGSHKIQATGYDAFGITGQARVITEGVDTTEGNSGAGFYQDYYAQSEIAVSAAGQDVTMNTPGALIVATVKSGGNQFKALFNQTWEGRQFVGRNVDAATAARGFTGQPNLLFWETHGDLGGPILRDQLWFFVSRNHFHADKAISGVPQSVATDLGIVDDVTTKETWKPGARDTLIGYYQWQHKQAPLRGLSVTRGPQSTLAQSSYAWMYDGRWQRVWTNRLFTGFTVGEWGYDFPEKPSIDYRTNPPRTDLVTGVDTGAGFTQGGIAGPFDAHPAKPQVFGTATYYLPTKHRGGHDLKAGFEWLDDRTSVAYSGASGPLLYLDSNGAPSEIRLTDLGNPADLGRTWSAPDDGDRRLALYAQDRWSLANRVTLTAGLRYDRQRPYYTASKRDPVLAGVFPAVTTPARTLFVRNTFAPRLGVSYDPAGDGRSAVKAFWGRYDDNFSTMFAGVDPGGVNTRTYVFHDLNGNGLYDGPQELGALVASTGGASTSFDPNLKTPYTDEIDVSYERQVWRQSALRVAYVRKMSRNALSTFNAAWQGQFTVPVVVPLTLQGVTGGTPAVQTFTVYDVPEALRGVVDNAIANTPASAGGGAADYDTAEVAFNEQIGHEVFLDASYDFTWQNDLRTPVGTSNSPLTQADPIAEGYYENAYPAVSNRQRTTDWVFHLSGRYALPWAIGVGANLAVQSGWNYARVITVQLPGSGTQRFWLQNLDANRSQTVPLLDLRLDKAWPIGGHRLTGMLDVFNVLNSNAVVNFNLANGPRFDQINGALDPRTLELGLRFEF